MKIRTPEADEIAQLVQDPNIQAGKWKSPYDIYEWRFIANMPWRLQPAVKVLQTILHPLQDWELEAFRIEDDTNIYTSLHIAARSRTGRSPLNVRLFGRLTVPLKEILPPLLSPLAERFPIQLRYREFMLVEFPVIFCFLPEGENANNIDPNLIPAYDKVIIKPFWYFQGEGEKEKAVAEDPFRLVFHISGAPKAYIRSELLRLGSDDISMQRVWFDGTKNLAEVLNEQV